MIRITVILGGLALILSGCADLFETGPEGGAERRGTTAIVAPDEMLESADDLTTAMTAPVPRRKPAISTAEVEELQTGLRQLGHDPGPVDGILGPQTRNAVRAYQEAAGLPVDGMVTRDLIAALRASQTAGMTKVEPPVREPATAAATPAATEPPPEERGLISRVLGPLFRP